MRLHRGDDDVRGGHPTHHTTRTPHTHTCPAALNLGHGCRPTLHHRFACCHWQLISKVATCNTAYDLRFTSSLRLHCSHLLTAFWFQCSDLLFQSSISHFWQLNFVYNFHLGRGQLGMCECVVYGWYDVWGGPPVHHHHVVQSGILGVSFVFSYYVWCLFYRVLFLIFGLLSCLVQKTRLTSRMHFFKWFSVSIVCHATLTKGSNHCFKWRRFVYKVRQLKFEGGDKG